MHARTWETKTEQISWNHVKHTELHSILINQLISRTIPISQIRTKIKHEQKLGHEEPISYVIPKMYRKTTDAWENHLH